MHWELAPAFTTADLVWPLPPRWVSKMHYVGYVRHFCSGEVISLKFSTSIGFDCGMQSIFAETVFPKIFSLRPK